MKEHRVVLTLKQQLEANVGICVETNSVRKFA